MSFLKTVSITFGNQILIYILALLSNIITARVLGPAGKGQVAAAFAIGNTIFMFANLGIAQGVINTGARSLENAKKSAFASMIFSFVNSISAITVLFLLAHFDTNLTKNITKEIIYLLAIGAPFTLLVGYLESVLLANENIVSMNLVISSGEVIRLTGLVLFLITGSLTVFNVIALWVVTMMLNTILAIYLVRKHIGFLPFIQLDYYGEILKIGIKSFLVSIAGFLLLRSDMIMLNYFRTSAEVGIYSIAVSLADKVMVLPKIVGRMLLPKTIKHGSQLNEFQAKVSRFNSLILLFLLFGVLIAAYPAILILFGSKFLPSVEPLIILLPGIYFLGMTQILGQYFAAQGYPWISFVSPTTSLAINVVLNIFLIPLWGYNAAALTSTVGYFSLYIIYYFKYRSETGFSLSEILIPRTTEVNEVYGRVKARISKLAVNEIYAGSDYFEKD